MALFGNWFDFNKDGKLSDFEKATELFVMYQLLNDDDEDDEDYDYDEDIDDVTDEQNIATEDVGEDDTPDGKLIAAGIDPIGFSYLMAYEKVETLIDAELDPYDFDLSVEAYECTELLNAGINLWDFYNSDEEDARQMLLEAGLDPTDFGIF